MWITAVHDLVEEGVQGEGREGTKGGGGSLGGGWSVGGYGGFWEIYGGLWGL